jgi:hypothetical protein
LRKRSIAALAAPVALAGIMAFASGASADQAPANCPEGYLCVYPGLGDSEPPALTVSEDWSGSVDGRSFINNSDSQAVELTWTTPWLNGETLTRTQCFEGHYHQPFYTLPAFKKAVFVDHC